MRNGIVQLQQLRRFLVIWTVIRRGIPTNSRRRTSAGIPSIVAGDDTLISKRNDMPGTGTRHAGNGSDDGLTMMVESATVEVV